MVSQAHIDLERVRRERRRRSARDDFLSFVEYTKPDYETNWHHAALARKLQWWAETPGAKLIVCMPPRRGKSELVSRRLPAYLLGRHPEWNIIACSYGQDLANAMSRDVQSIMQSPQYLSLFPSSRLPFRQLERRKLAVAEWELAYRTGSYRAAGVGSGVTGRGMDAGIVDDPFKDDAEAESPRMRERVWQWYHGTFRTRRAPGARELITMTRWHHDDLVGRMLASEGDSWSVFVLPEVREESATMPEDTRDVGEYLWPSKYPAEETEDVRKMKRVWNAAYRQNPSEGEGNVFRRSMFGRYQSLPLEPFAEFVLSIDASFKDTKSSSRVSMQMWARAAGPPAYYLLDEECGQMGYLATLAAARNIISRWPDAAGRLVVLIEDKANGPALIESMRTVIPSVLATTPRESKYARANATLPVVSSGCVFVPAELYAIGGVRSSEWVEDWLDEQCEFPYHAFNDRVDAMTQVLRYFAENNWELNFGPADGPELDELEQQTSSYDWLGTNGKGKTNGKTNGKTTWPNPFSRL